MPASSDSQLCSPRLFRRETLRAYRARLSIAHICNPTFGETPRVLSRNVFRFATKRFALQNERNDGTIIINGFKEFDKWFLCQCQHAR